MYSSTSDFFTSFSYPLLLNVCMTGFFIFSRRVSRFYMQYSIMRAILMVLDLFLVCSGSKSFPSSSVKVLRASSSRSCTPPIRLAMKVLAAFFRHFFLCRVLASALLLSCSRLPIYMLVYYSCVCID